ncbi:MAG: ATP-binding cassette domain-containing protein [Candidatus Accumulibacter sp.]|nr:ATP-binding cassette domain-containing protein [Accumulibacter sp.]
MEKSFGGLKVLTGVTFDVARGEKLALIGPNGAGKSTLINVIGGQLTASGGVVDFDGGRPIVSLPPNERLHLGLARSYQQNNLFWHLPVLDNVLLALYGAETSHLRFLKPLGQRTELLEEAEKLLTSADLWEKRHESPTTLSYGEQRLLELLLAFTSNPRMVLLDEPSAGLPTAEAFAFSDKLRKLVGSATLLFCAHDLDLVFNLADNIIVLCFGVIIARGTPDEIKANPQVQEIYLGSEDDDK